MAKKIYDYIGKKEIFRRAQNVSYIELPKMKELVYSKFEGCEWLKNEKIEITSQACGTWIRVWNYREHVDEILCGYDGEGNFSRHYPVCRKTPCFSYGDIRHFHRIYASN